MSARYIVGDSLAVLRSLPDASVDLALTSPPFLGLRSYLPADHPDQAAEMGSEATPGEFIDALLDIVEECRRVLAPHGSLVFELGDTYAGSGGAGGDYGADGLREGQEKFVGSGRKARRVNGDYPNRDDHPRPNRNGRRSRPEDEAAGILAPHKRPGPEGRDSIDGWPLDKSLCFAPELLRIAMVYGFNPLTGRETPRWRARNVVRWCRPNPPVGALADKVRPATSDLIVACVGRKRYFDLDAVRTAPQVVVGRNVVGNNTKGSDDQSFRFSERVDSNPAGAPPLDHWWFDEDTFSQDAWLISTEPYKGSHYATWPTDLLVRPIEAMCPRRVCTTCGAPSERIVSIDHAPNRTTNGPQSIERKHLDGGSAGYAVRADRIAETTGWTDCGHGTWRNGLVLDPFGGSGTTAVVALGHGRDALLVDLDERNADLARERVGMWLTVEHHNAAETVA